MARASRTGICSGDVTKEELIRAQARAACSACTRMSAVSLKAQLKLLAGQHLVQLAARADAELVEHLAHVVLDSTCADEQPRRDLRIGQPVPGQPCDLGPPGRLARCRRGQPGRRACPWSLRLPAVLSRPAPQTPPSPFRPASRRRYATAPAPRRGGARDAATHRIANGRGRTRDAAEWGRACGSPRGSTPPQPLRHSAARHRASLPALPRCPRPASVRPEDRGHRARCSSLRYAPRPRPTRATPTQTHTDACARWLAARPLAPLDSGPGRPAPGRRRSGRPARPPDAARRTRGPAPRPGPATACHRPGRAAVVARPPRTAGSVLPSPVFPTPGSPRSTRTWLSPVRTASTSRSSVSRSSSRSMSFAARTHDR